MVTEKLTTNDKRLIAVVLLAAAAAIVYVKFNYSAAFPDASIDLRYSKAQITRMAEEFLQKRNLAPSGFRNLTLFDPDDSARIYLERELGLEAANRLMQGPVSVWRWRARWFRPPQKEERIVLLSPTGALVGFEHIIAEETPGARLEMDAARKIAETFLEGRTHTPRKIIEEQLQERPNRHDFVFTWEQEGFRAKDATYRRSVVIQGDTVGRYSEYLHVPEKWERDFANLRSKNELYSQIAQALWLVLGLAALAVLIRSFRRRLIHWRPLLLISGTVSVLMVINAWNSLPFYIDRMPTSSPYPQSVLFGLLSGLGSGVGVFFLVILAAAAGEPLYRSMEPRKLSLLAVSHLRSVRTREFFLATIVGYGFAAAHIAFVVAFYLFGRRFGVWSPQDVNYSDFLSTALPWIFPVAISLLASTSEEFWFRLLAIPMLKRRARLTWLAVIVPAFLWGFLHANYPQQPPYIRGIEVGIIGVAAGFLMLRFGILATLVWHYAVDAALIGTFLIQAESWYFQLSGWLVAGAVLLPLILSVVSYRKHGGFLVDSALLNSGVAGPPESPEVKIEPPAAEPLVPVWPRKWLYGAALAAGACGLFIHADEFGDFIRVRITRAEAQAIAGTELASKVPDAAAWRSVTSFQPNLYSGNFEYVRRIEGSGTANEIVAHHTDTGFWRTRLFKPMQKEEWRVHVSQDGGAIRTDHVLREDAPGADLTATEARDLARGYLSRRQNIPAGEWNLVDSSSTKRDHRTDHNFVWEDPAFRLGEARARVTVDVIGDQPSGFQRFLKLPEEWLREFHKPRLGQIIVPGTLGALALLLLVVFVKRLSAERHYHWKTYAATAAAGICVAALSALNQWPSMLAGYRTAVPLESYWTELAISRAMGIVLLGLAVFLAMLAADVFLQLVLDGRNLNSPSILRAATVFALVWGFARVFGALRSALPGPRLSLPLWDLPGAESLSPAVNVLASAFFASVFAVCLLAVVVSAATRYLKRRDLWAGIGGMGILYAASQAQNFAQFAFCLGATLLTAGVVILLAKTCAADLVTFAVAVFWLRVSAPAMTLVEQPAPFYYWNGLTALAAAALIGIAVLHRMVRKGRWAG